MANYDLTLSSMRLAQIESKRNGHSALEGNAERNTSRELVLYKGGETSEQYPATWKENWRARHRDLLWTEYNKETYKIVPCPTLASGILPTERPGCHYTVQIRYKLAFTCFKKLPAELRLKIWHHALPAPRVVQVLTEWKEPRGHWDPPGDRFRCRLVPNNAFGRGHLLSCRESAIIFRETYSQFTIGGAVSEGGGFFTRVAEAERQSIGYIDYTRDVLAFDFMDLKDLAKIGVTFDLPYVERLALVVGTWPLSFSYYDLCQSIQVVCASLKEFTYVLESDIGGFRDLGPSSSLQLVPLDWRLNHIDFYPAYPEAIHGQNLPDWIRFAQTMRRIFEENREQDVGKWQGVSFEVSLLAHAREEKRIIIEETWLAPVEPEPYDVIYWMNAEYYEALPSKVYFPALAVEAIQGKDGELGNLYTGITALFDE